MNLLHWLQNLLKEPSPTCPRCHGLLTGEPEQGLYCEACHTTFETAPDIRYDEPTRGIEYRLTGKSYYGKPR